MVEAGLDHTPDASSDDRRKNDVFISYSRRDSNFANKLLGALKNYIAPPQLKVAIRTLKVFLDSQDFEAGAYQDRLREYLGGATKLVVICSPHARASQYVNDEVAAFASLRGAENIIPVLIDGLADNEATAQEEHLKAFPPALVEILGMPTAIDYRGFPSSGVGISRARFQSAWFMLLAAIFDVSRSDIELREEQRRSKRRRIQTLSLSGAIVILSILLVAIYISRKQAVTARQLAESRDRYSRRLLYVSDMSLARIEFSSGNISRGLDLLDTYLPGSKKSSVDDERSFYWYYLWSTFHNEERTLAGHDDEVTEVAYAPDGRTLASGGFADYTIKLWNPFTGAQVAALSGHSLPISGLLFFPDGHRLLSSSNDESVRIWDVATAKQLQQLDGDKGISISSIALNSVGDKIAAVSRDVKLWNLESHSTSSIPTSEKFGFYIAFSPDGQLLAWSTSGAQIRVWRPLDHRMLFRKKLSESHPGAVTVAPDGSTIAYRVGNSDIQLWNLKQQRDEGQLKADGNSYSLLSFSTTGNFVAGEREPGVIRIWNVKTHERIVDLFGHKLGVSALCFSPDGSTLSSGGNDHAVKLWRVQARPGTTLGGRNLSATSVAFSPDGTMVAAGGSDPRIHLWNTESRSELRGLDAGPNVIYGLSFSRDERFLAGGSSKEVRVWDLPSGNLWKVLRGNTEDVLSVTFSPTQDLLASSGSGHDIRIWSLPAGTGVATLDRHQGDVFSVQFSPDGHLLASGSHDGTVKLWDTTTWKDTATLSIGSEVGAVAFNSAGTLIAAGSYDSNIEIWDVHSRTEVGTLRGHAKSVCALGFSPDGRTLASASEDGTVKLWDIDTLQEIATLPPTSTAWSLQFSPRGRMLVLGAGEVDLLIGADDQQVQRQRRP